MSQRSRFILLVSIGVLVIGLAWRFVQPERLLPNDQTSIKNTPIKESTRATQEVESVGEMFEHSTVSRPSTTGQDRTVLPPLPAADKPFAAQLSSLVQLAKAGEPTAACRLALDSLYCKDYEQNSSFMKQVNAGMGARTHEIGNDLAATLIINSEDSLATGSTYCAGLAEKQLPTLDEFLSLALPNLSTRQKILLVLARPNGAIVQIIKDPRTMATSGGDTRQVYSQFLADHALEFLQDGIASADPMALEGMILVHVPSRVPDRGVDVFPSLPNPYKFAGYALLMQQLSGPASLGPFVSESLNTVLAGLTIEQLQTLQRAVDVEAKRWQVFQEKDRFARIDPKKMRASSLCVD